VGVQERLTYDAVSAHSISSTEHVHRYEWAAELCRGRRALDLACGIGYGSAILRSAATAVTGVDISAAAIEAARSHYGGEGISFEVADAHEVLRRDLEKSVDVLVCFEGLEHLQDFETALEQLTRLAQAGVRLILSVPNSRGFDEQNEFHVSDFGYESAHESFSDLPDATIQYQWVAEGSLLGGPGELPDVPARIVFSDRAEVEYANNFLITANVPADELEAATAAHMHLQVAPYYNRQLRLLEAANEELWRVNSELGRRLRRLARHVDEPADGERPESVGKSDTAAALKLAKGREQYESDLQRIIRERDEVAEAMREQERRAEEAEARLERLERELSGLRRAREKRRWRK
jgi:2-polyprenyl-3-methyl-5-hydroxy-6-metoxy-1,4-benzoquinol methylase